MTKTEATNLPVMFASLRLKGADLDPVRVSGFFGAQPTLAYKKGDVFIPRTKNAQERRRQFGVWLYSTEKDVASSDLGDHLKLIRSVMGPAAPVRAIVIAENYELLVSIFWFGGVGQQRPSIPEPFRRLVGNAGGILELDFDSLPERDGHRAAQNAY